MKLEFLLTDGEGIEVGCVYTANGERKVIKLDPAALDSFDGSVSLKRPESEGDHADELREEFLVASVTKHMGRREYDRAAYYLDLLRERQA